ncbi:MAG: polyketide cyclase [Moraxellaceae bacterium]|nr:MAG: polyketide cyclase [Moraxellaceae bacterium]
MSKPDYMYITYIATTPQKLWQALIDTEITRKYWFDHINVSDWAPGSRWEHQRTDDAKTLDVVGTVIDADAPNRLVVTWARPTEFEDDAKHARLTFDIATHSEGVVRLTVTHEKLDTQMLNAISGGWPKVLANLKTFLETGHTLQFA